MRTIVAAALLCMHAVASGETKPIPEATRLHPELHTIQFTLAHVGSDFQLIAPGLLQSANTKTGNSMDPSILSEEEIRNSAHELLRKKQRGERANSDVYDEISRIQNANPTYSSLSTVHVELGKEFTTNEGKIQGLLHQEAKTVENLRIKYKDHPIIEVPAISVDTRSWFPIGVQGLDENFFVLVKLYEPRN